MNNTDGVVVICCLWLILQIFKVCLTYEEKHILRITKEQRKAEAQAIEEITKKYTCEYCSDRYNCFKNDSFLKCEYYKEHYDWVASVLDKAAGSSDKEGKK